ncbi:hypothetical protein AVEN_251640-1 [Araneus ventricosus]|uniref:Uncharacterized protein n=1 Tax=Araneus ventricosus TaxID=182803 RepID=A0A4Y2FR29_ARAVE|nr:hypothetical protein AVEN_251640-1 [Araneus ventricosus]
MKADPLSSRYPRIEVPNWNRWMEFWILSSLEFHHVQSICFKFHRFTTLTIGFSLPCSKKFQNGATVNGLLQRWRERKNPALSTTSNPFAPNSIGFSY